MAAFPLRREHFEIAIICVLKIEGDAVEALLTETFSGLGKAEHDENFYTTGILGGKPIVLVAPRGMGTLNAANAARDMRQSFTRIKLALVTGVAGGATSTPEGDEILLGDVLISTQILQSDFGRNYADVVKIKDGLADTLGRPRQELANFLNHLQRSKCVQVLTKRINEYITEDCLVDVPYPGHGNDHLFPSDYPHRHRGDHLACICEVCTSAGDPVCDEAQDSKCDALHCDIGTCVRRRRIQDCQEPVDIRSGLSQQQILRRQNANPVSGPALPAQIHFGIIASSSQVLKNSKLRDELVTTRNVIGFEMEGAGCWDTFPTIVVKSVCDYADSHKNKQWQSYASAMAACCARGIVEEWQTSQTMTVGIPRPKTPSAFSYATPEQLEIRKAILRGLFVTNPLDDLYSVKQRIRNGLGHASGTCRWLQAHWKFRQWLDRPKPQILSLVGTPGIGKSTLSTAILSHLESADHCFAFFFCDAAIPARRTYLAVVKSILRQLLKQGSASLPDELVDDYHTQGQALFSNVQALTRHLLGVLHQTVFGGIRILVDGLDEIEQSSRSNVFDLFARLCRGEPEQDRKPNVRIILSHHPGRFPNHANTSPEFFQVIDVDEEWAVRCDIDKYIDAEISDLAATQDWSEEITKRVKRTLQEKSGGTFLWAALALRSLHDARPDDALDRLEEFPPGLDAMYERLLRQIPDRDRATAAFALHCVVANIPRLTEITFGAMLACMEVSKSQNPFPSAFRIRELRTAWKSCQVFLRAEGRERCLRSIHQSVEYFFAKRNLPEDLFIFRFERSQVVMQVAKTCRDYLASAEFQRMEADIKSTMAKSFMANSLHAEISVWEVFDSIEHCELLKFAALNTRTSRNRSWLLDHQPTMTTDQALIVQSERAAFWHGVWRRTQQQSLGFEHDLFSLIERAAPQLSKIAIATQQTGLVNVLEAVSEGWWSRYFGLVDASGECDQTERSPELQAFIQVLVNAVVSGAVGFAETLTSHVRTSRETYGHGTSARPLVCAFVVKNSISSGHVHSAMEFIKATRSLVASYENRTYLHCLAQYNVSNAIQLLIDSGDDPNYGDGFDSPPILVAAKSGSFESLKILFKACPFDYYAAHHRGNDLLSYAIQGNCVRSLRFLLEAKGFSDDDEQFEWGSLLGAAAYSGSDKCLEVLLKANASAVNDTDSCGKTALHCACHFLNLSRSRCLSCIQILLDFGADLAIKNDRGETAINCILSDDRKVETVFTREAISILWPHVTPEMVQADSADRTLLHGAAKHGLLECVEDLLVMGADLERVDCCGRSALHLAAISGRTEVVQMLLERSLPLEMLWARDSWLFEHTHLGIYLSKDRRTTRTSLHDAAFSGHLEIVRLLVAADTSGKSLHTRDGNLQLPVDLPRGVQDLDVERALLKLDNSFDLRYLEIGGRELWEWARASKEEWEDYWSSELQPMYREIVKTLEKAPSRFDVRQSIDHESKDAYTGDGEDSEDFD